MIQVPFSAAAAAILVGAVIVGGAVGVMTSPPADAPAVEASTGPAPAAAATPPSNDAAAGQSQTPEIRQTIVETVPLPSPPAPAPQVTTEETETTTVVSAPVIVTSWGLVSGCVGCIERRNDDKAHHPAAKTEHTTPQHLAATRKEIPPHVRFVRLPQVASASVHNR